MGLILAVPPQNIIGTFHDDVWFPNHVGNMPGQRRNSYELADHYFNGISKESHNPAIKDLLEKMMPNKTYAELETPDTIIRRTKGDRHNEIIVVGKANVNIYSGLPPTKNIQVCGIYHLFDGGGRHDKTKWKEDNKLIKQLLALNPGLPVLRHYINWEDPYSDSWA